MKSIDRLNQWQLPRRVKVLQKKWDALRMAYGNMEMHRRKGLFCFPRKSIVVLVAKLCPEKDKWNKARKKVNAGKKDKNGW